MEKEVTSKPFKPNNTLITLLIVFLVLTTGAAVCFACQTSQLKKQIKELEKQSGLKTPSPAIPTEVEKVNLSPEGKIAFTRGSVCDKNQDIWIVNADGSGEKKLTNDGYCGFSYFSPDGKWIAYNSISSEIRKEITSDNCAWYESGGNDIWLIKPDGTNARQLKTKIPLDITKIYWSPDSKKIAVFSQQRDIIVIDIDKNKEIIFEDAGPPGMYPDPPVWVDENNFLYIKYLQKPHDYETSGLVMANIHDQTVKIIDKDIHYTMGLYSYPEKKSYLYANDDQKLVEENPFTNQKKEIDIDTSDLENYYFTKSKFLPEQKLIVSLGHLRESEIHEYFISVTNLATQKVSLVRTGLKFSIDNFWCTDGNWVILRAVSVGEEKEIQPPLWKVNLETTASEKIVKNASYPSCHLIPLADTNDSPL